MNRRRTSPRTLPALSALGCLAACALATAGAQAPPAGTTPASASATGYVRPEGKTLRELARQRGKEFGANIGGLYCGGHGTAKGKPYLAPERWEDDPKTLLNKAIIADHFTMVSAGWQMYPGHSWVGEREYCSATTDRMMDWARQNGLTFHGHGAGYVQRGWPAKLPMDTEAQRAHFRDIYESYTREYVGRFGDRVALWDVLNEHARYGYYDNARGFNDFPYLKAYGAAPGQEVPGLDYYLTTFRLVHEAAPKAKLLYLDFGNEIVSEKSNSMYRVARTLKERGAPLHAVGYQLHQNVDFTRVRRYDHLQNATPPQPLHGLSDDAFLDSMRENTQRFADLGLEVWVTELDVKPDPSQPAEERYRRQADVYRRFIEVALESDALKGVKVWGVADNEKEDWYLFDARGRAKPAFYAVRDAFEHYRPRAVAEDRFDAAGSGGGSGWAAPWRLEGGATVASGGGFTGARALALSGDGQGAARAVPLAGRNKALLSYRWSCDGYGAGGAGRVLVEVSRDGRQWEAVKAHDEAERKKRGIEGEWHAGFATVSRLDGEPRAWVRLRAVGDVARFRVDDLRVVADSLAD